MTESRPTRDQVPLSAWAEIDLDALRGNLAAVRALLPPRARILLTIKADAYGLGAVAVARAAETAGVSMFGIATLDEGIELREAGIAAPLLLLSPPLPDEAALIVRFDLQATVGSIEVAHALARAAEAAGRRAVVHVEVDTGMGRSGVRVRDAASFFGALAGLPALDVEGVYTHFPSSNENDLPFALEQVRRFDAFCAELSGAGHLPRIRHAANSAALLIAPGSHFDMVRPGLIAYGHPPLDPFPGGIPIRPALQLKSRLLQVREFDAGESVSYGRSFFTKRPSRLGVMAIGYGHGLSRRLSNRGEVLVRGMRAPIVGRVTMDTTMVDVTDVAGVVAGDEVVLIGRQGSGEITIDEVAAWQETISYEVSCLIGRRVARVYLEQGKPAWVRTMVGIGTPARAPR